MPTASPRSDVVDFPGNARAKGNTVQEELFAYDGGDGMPPELNERVVRLETIAEHLSVGIDKIDRRLEKIEQQNSDLNVSIVNLAAALPRRVEYWVGVAAIVAAILSYLYVIQDGFRVAQPVQPPVIVVQPQQSPPIEPSPQ